MPPPHQPAEVPVRRTSMVSRPSSHLSMTCLFRACLRGLLCSQASLLTGHLQLIREGGARLPHPLPQVSPDLTCKRHAQVRSTASHCLRLAVCRIPMWLHPVLRGCCPLATQLTDGKIEASACLRPALELTTCQPGRCCRILSPHSGH